MKIIDLCSGLGGASEAFIQAGDEVLRIENNILLMTVPNTELMTVQQFRDFLIQLVDDGHQLPDIDLIWASPPCLAFSNAYSAPQSKARRDGAEYTPDLGILKTCMEIIDILQPRYYIIENVGGAVKWFEPLLGDCTKLGASGLFLWGNFPPLNLPKNWSHSKTAEDVWSSNPLRANLRGLIPFEVSAATRGAIISQRVIWDYC
jgi:site-specific DNA-cytosine methylase